MSTGSWKAVGWLRKDKKGNWIGYCDNCKKKVILNHNGEYDSEFESYSCSVCGEVVLDD